MKVVIVSEYNHLTSIGGTEYYTNMLAKGLASSGFQVTFISLGRHKSGLEEFVVPSNGTSYVLILLPHKTYTDDEVKQRVISSSWSEISTLLQRLEPDIIHVHTLSTFFNVRHFEACHGEFNRIIFTSHVPEHFCLKGDMIRNNLEPCDGYIGLQCNICLFTASYKKGFSSLIRGYVGRLKTNMESIFSMGVLVVCTSEWQKKQLLLNGLPESQIFVIRQALETDICNIVMASPPCKIKLRVGYLGRLTIEKGAKMLLDLLSQSIHFKDVEFVLGIPPNVDTDLYKSLKDIIKLHGNKIKLMTHIGADNKADFFSSIDVLFIPSFCVETGPIVLLEGLIHGKVVIAPDNGGAAEFRDEYSNFVKCYKWNDLKSVLKLIKTITEDHRDANTEMRTDFTHSRGPFISQHIKLYETLAGRFCSV
jgi:glycosyltransferase involved in cell wall biosynthesis